MPNNKKTNINLRTDLALEISESIQKDRGEPSSQLDGVKVEQSRLKEDEIDITKVIIDNDKGAKTMGRLKGSYITIESQNMKINDPDAHKKLIDVFSNELLSLIPQSKNKSVLIVGLGNSNATPDALGPMVASQVIITRHIKQTLPWQIDNSVCDLSSLTPGVMGITGIETSEIVTSVAKSTKPDYILVIDALGARSASRVNTTIQLNNTGIEPGSGIGNKRKAITQETTGCPVIAIGVPTVVDAATLVSDMVDNLVEAMLAETEDKSFYNMLKELSEQEKYTLAKEVMYPHIGDMFVTPKEIDEVMIYLSKIISNGINIAMHPGITLDDINRFQY